MREAYVPGVPEAGSGVDLLRGAFAGRGALLIRASTIIRASIIRAPASAADSSRAAAVLSGFRKLRIVSL
jgi:hypothetical protein